MLLLYLVRHGQTPWNVQGRVQGGGPLNELGRAQAAALGERLHTQRFDSIYASPALRARQTARAVANRLGMKVHQRALLSDLDYGNLAGAFLETVRLDNRQLYEQWRTMPHTVHFDGGESLSHLRARIVKFIERSYRRFPDGQVLAATHDSPVRVAVSMAMGRDDAEHNAPDLRAPLASLTILEVDQEGVRIRLRNDVGHLDDVQEK